MRNTRSMMIHDRGVVSLLALGGFSVFDQAQYYDLCSSVESRCGMRLPLIVAFGIVASLSPLYADKPKATRNVEITAEDEKIRDAAGFEAIKEIHRLMDDDHSGSIDRFESNDFLQEDLQITGSDRAQRERAFHHDDDAITVDDMWESWFESDERAWDEQTVLDWLINFVRLPQYEKNFTENKVTGVSLPRMAIQNSSYLSSVLGIKSYVHRQKLQLKALDLVLFGFHEVPQSKAKDIFIALLVAVCTGCAVYMKRLHGTSQKHVAALTKKLTEITSMETDFAGVEKRFDGEETDSIKALKEKLHDAEKRLEMSGPDAVSFALQPLLRRTYEIEVTCINEKKAECLAEMREAKEFVDRMRKKQTGIMNSIKLAAGATVTGADTVDAKVYSLRARMEKISAAMAECQERWIKIESTCGFSIAGSYACCRPVELQTIFSCEFPPHICPNDIKNLRRYIYGRPKPKALKSSSSTGSFYN
uniref:SAM domain-containing protein n=1 Tax=Panagrellus redivivus TaxID=6233 RepID=A0A7E4VDH8_PANRE